ncbi:hypothetical protein J4460_01635 [Candidatus Woesearchaeota archaeon]|nr:hypothetical protein [Candidatus Woesearchaeota archaeon]HIH37616.1 hypothetical protein [Candidatus Woesearchaeota archaeon]HIH48768.1 hypothetical protein [Candidatus Woesearchaeota archaeon]HIJ03577.1 hypothetical protein [Candidatus Woesearchaeota archaeon]
MTEQTKPRVSLWRTFSVALGVGIGIGIGYWGGYFFNRPEQSEVTQEKVMMQREVRFRRQLAEDLDARTERLPIRYREIDIRGLVRDGEIDFPTLSPYLSGYDRTEAQSAFDHYESFPFYSEFTTNGNRVIRLSKNSKPPGDGVFLDYHAQCNIGIEEFDQTLSPSPHRRKDNLKMTFIAHGRDQSKDGNTPEPAYRDDVDLPFRNEEHVEGSTYIQTNGLGELTLDLLVYDPQNPGKDVTICFTSLTVESVDYNPPPKR